jgi:hypothetical protein
MKKQIRTLTLCGSILALASLSAQAGVSYTIDSGTTSSSTSWSGSSAGTLAQSIMTPNLRNSGDGGVSSGIIFKAGSSFTLGAVEIWQASMTGGSGSFNLFLIDLGSSYSLPAGNPLYTFTGSEANLFSGGLSVTLPNANQFDIFTFSGADNVSINAGNSYWFGLVAADGTSNLGWNRGGATANQAIGVNATVAVGGAGTVLNNGNTGANRTPIGAFFAAPVPEPSSMALLGTGLLTFIMIRRSKRG